MIIDRYEVMMELIKRELKSLKALEFETKDTK